jgi:hypothetical protein
MPDWLSNADVWMKFAGVLTTILSFMTALLTLLKTRAPVAALQQAAQVTTFRRLRTEPLEEPSRPRPLFWTKCLVIATGALSVWMAARAFPVFASQPSALTALPFLVFGGCTALSVISAWRIWRRLGSIAKRETTINVQGDYDRIWEGCIAALKRMKVDIKTIDAKKGLIEGDIGLSWKSWGEIVVVQITRIGADQCSVQLKSDSKLMTTALDYGKNSSNIRRLVEELVY